MEIVKTWVSFVPLRAVAWERVSGVTPLWGGTCLWVQYARYVPKVLPIRHAGTKESVAPPHETKRHYASLFTCCRRLVIRPYLELSSDRIVKSYEPCLDSKGTRYFLLADDY